MSATESGSDALSWGGRAAGALILTSHLHLVPRLSMSGATPLLHHPPYSFSGQTERHLNLRFYYSAKIILQF